MADESKPRRRLFGPLFYSTALVAVIVLSIQAVVTIRDWVGGWMRAWEEAQSIQRLVDATRDEGEAVRAQAFRSLSDQTRTFRSFTERPSRLRELAPVFLAGSTDADETVRTEAARGLGFLVNVSPDDSETPTREDREQCLQALRRLLKDPSFIVRDAASNEIGIFATARGVAGFEGKAAIVADLTAALSDPDRAVRIVAARTLLLIQGDRDQAAVDALLALLADPQPIADRGVVATILENHHQSESASKVLASLLSSGNPLVLPDVLSCIESLGPDAESALPKLEPLLDDQDPGVRAGAGRAILAIEGVGLGEGTPSPRAIALSVKAVADQELPMEWRMTAAEMVLGAHPAALSHAAGVLVKQLASDEPAVRRSAVDLLSMLVEQVRPEPPNPNPGR